MPKPEEEVSNLEQLLDRIQSAAEGRERVSLELIVDKIGRRSFGPLLLLPGVVLASPLSGIPGMPTAMGLFVLVTAVQMLLRRERLWLPRWLLNRSIDSAKLQKAMNWLRPPARWIDRWLRPRAPIFVRSPAATLIAAICVVIGAGIPIMELVPFSATGAGMALTAFGLSLIACDGLLALIATIFVFLTLGVFAYHLL